jgi:precorrin-6Y C5,15-methyltransferase (decarboxylating)
MCKHFIVIGIDDNETQWFAPKVEDIISSHKVFSGGKRHHQLVQSHLPSDCEWIDITVPLEDVFRRYQSYDVPIVVFASGDPLFFGFASTIQRILPEARIELFPHFNSLQTLAHRLLMPYHDLRMVSLTGRSWHEFDTALIQQAPKIGVLTDGQHTPSTIAARMLHYGYDNYEMIVGEHLGSEYEVVIDHLTLEEITHTTFSRPNCLILKLKHLLPTYSFGIPDHLFSVLEGRPQMITKAPVRLLTLSALDLPRRTSLWDIGFCTGSISIEARLLFPHLHVTGFEVRQEGKELMEENAKRFHVPGIQFFITDFMDIDLDQLHDEEGLPIARPDTVFIGGHGGNLPEMMTEAHRYLQPGGVMVYNCVDPQTITDPRIRKDSEELFFATAHRLGMQAEEPLCVAINNYHPIHILKATKK